MSEQIDTAVVQQFKRGITILAQQKASRFRRAVRVEAGDKGDRAFYDQLGLTAMHEVISRHAPTEYHDTPHLRRMVTYTNYDNADLIDEEDKIQVLNDPTNAYVRAFGYAAGRRMDQTVIDAAFASASTGKTGSTSTAFDTAFDIAAGSAGLTTAKLLEAKELLDAAENSAEEPMFVAVTARQLRDLLTETGSFATSADFVERKALITGEIDVFAGFRFIRSELLSVDGSSIRSCIAWKQNSLLLDVRKDIEARITPDLATHRYATQVYIKMGIGATRMDETGVVRIFCDES